MVPSLYFGITCEKFNNRDNDDGRPNVTVTCFDLFTPDSKTKNFLKTTNLVVGSLMTNVFMR